tara:strand:+ start:203 stop:553 length:351 start_codon:yes stop_codon:yes gene_type:complete
LQISELVKACLLMAAGQTFVWFQLYSHYVWKWWENKALLPSLVFGIPASLCFWYGVRMAVDATNEAWSARMLGFGMSYLTFPILTWWLLNESMLTTKTMICVVLSFIIVTVQLFWR